MNKKCKILVLGVVSLLGVMAAGIVFFAGKPRVEIRCSIVASQAFPLDFYFTQDEETWFRERIAIQVPQGASDVIARFPVERLRKLRVDFGSVPGRMKIGKLRVCGHPSILLDWNDFSQKKDIDRYDVTSDGTLFLSSRRNDPYVVYGKSLDIGARRFAGRLFCWFASFAILALLVFIATLLGIDSWLRRIWNVACTHVVMPFLHEWQKLAMSARRFLNELWADKPFLVYMVVVLLLGWGFELANLTFTFDDEGVLFARDEGIAWIMQGRWGMFLMVRILGNPSVPVIPLLLTLCLYALSFCMLFRSHANTGCQRYLLFPLYLLFPVLFQSFSFSSLNPGVGFGFLFGAMSACFTVRKGWLAFFLGCVFGALAMGLYQIFLVYICIGACHLLISRLEADAGYAVLPRFRNDIGRMILVLLGSCSLYKLIQILFVALFEIQNDDFVSQAYIRPIADLITLQIWCRLVAAKIWAFLSGSRSVYPISMFGLMVLMGFSVLVLLASLFQKKGARLIRFIVVFGCLLIILMPFFPDALSRHAAVPLRVVTLLLPLALVSFMEIVLRKVQAKRIKRVVYCLCAYVAGQFAWALNTETFFTKLANQKDLQFAGEIKCKIDQQPECALAGTSLAIVGNCVYDRSYFITEGTEWSDWVVESVGRSLFAKPNRFHHTLRLYCGSKYSFCNIIAIMTPQYAQRIENMPIWPLNGSIACLDGIIVIKFADYLPRTNLKGRKQIHRGPRQINGFEELVYTEVDQTNLIHEVTVRDVSAFGRGCRKNGTTEEKDLNIIGESGSRVYLKPFKTREPYVILEMEVSLEEADRIGFWGDVKDQQCIFSFPKGDSRLRLRVPSYFLESDMLVVLGSKRVAKGVLIKRLRIYADRKYTENLLKLNPELKDSPLLMIGGKAR